MIAWEEIQNLVPINTFIPLFLAAILFNYYNKYRITDYALFGGVFTAAFFTGLFSNIALSRPNLLITYQIVFASTTLGYFLFSLHLRGITKKEYYSKGMILESAYVVFLLGLIAQWQLMEQPETAKFFFLELPRGSSAFYPNGAGLVLSDGTIILSTAHAVLAYTYWAVVGVRGAVTYWSLDLKVNNDVSRQVKRLWAIGWTILAIWAVTLLPYLYISEMLNLLVSLAYLVLFVIAFRYREALLLSHYQIIRSLEYYENSIIPFYDEELDKQIEFDQFDEIEENLLENFANIPEPILYDLLNKKADNPQAVFLISDSNMLKSIEFDKNIAESALIGNLVSALISFSNYTLSPEKSSRSFRFQTEDSKLVISPLGSVFICYMFTGNATSAEIRLKKFIIDQRKNKEVWENVTIEDTKAIDLKADTMITEWIDQAFNYEIENKEEYI